MQTFYLDYASDLIRAGLWISSVLAGGLLLLLAVPLAALLAVGLVIGGAASVIVLLLGELIRQRLEGREEEPWEGALVSGIPVLPLPGGWRGMDKVALQAWLDIGIPYASLPEEGIEEKAGEYPQIGEDAAPGLSDMDEGDVWGIEGDAVLGSAEGVPVPSLSDGTPYYDYSSPSDGFGPSAPILPPIDLVAENGGMDYSMTLAPEDMTREELVAAARAAGVRGASMRWSESTLIARIRSAGEGKGSEAGETVTATAALPGGEPASPPPLKPARKRGKGRKAS